MYHKPSKSKIDEDSYKERFVYSGPRRRATPPCACQHIIRYKINIHGIWGGLLRWPGDRCMSPEHCEPSWAASGWGEFVAAGPQRALSTVSTLFSWEGERPWVECVMGPKGTRLRACVGHVSRCRGKLTGWLDPRSATVSLSRSCSLPAQLVLPFPSAFRSRSLS